MLHIKLTFYLTESNEILPYYFFNCTLKTFCFLKPFGLYIQFEGLLCCGAGVVETGYKKQVTSCS